ncbi:MAG: PEP-CTERM sorting domain-containing protein [Cyanobacteria bacterium J06648_11]
MNRSPVRAGLLVAVCATFAAPDVKAAVLTIDDFTTPIALQTLLGANANDPFDANGQAGVQFPVSGSGILGSERDSQFWVGFGPENEEWSFGVDPARGLFWDADPNIHVNMNLEWDGFGDGTTFGSTLSPNPLRADLTGYTGFQLDFGFNTQPLDIRWIVGNKDLTGGLIPLGISQFDLTIPGGQTEPFAIAMPFSEFAAPFADFGIPAADYGDVNTLALSIFSADGVTGNSFELRSIAATPVPEPSSSAIFAGVLLGASAFRRKRAQKID